jgi:hypothetical protein
MSINRSLALLAIGSALAAAPLSDTAAQARTVRHHVYRHGTYAHRTYQSQVHAGYWPRQNAAGWRWRDNYRWDNTCLNVPWLADQFACSSHGR